jgi:hypothetical protein
MTRSRDTQRRRHRSRSRSSRDRSRSREPSTVTQTPLAEPLRVRFKSPLPKESHQVPFERLVQFGLCYHTAADITEQDYLRWMQEAMGADKTAAQDAWRVFLQVRCALNPETLARAERWREIHAIAEQYTQFLPPAGMDIASHMLRTHSAPARFCESLTNRLSSFL